MGPGKILNRLSGPEVPAKVMPARDQQSLCHWLTLRPVQRLLWDAMTLLLLSFIKAAMGTIAFFFTEFAPSLTLKFEFQCSLILGSQ